MGTVSLTDPRGIIKQKAGLCYSSRDALGSREPVSLKLGSGNFAVSFSVLAPALPIANHPTASPFPQQTENLFLLPRWLPRQCPPKPRIDFCRDLSAHLYESPVSCSFAQGHTTAHTIWSKLEPGPRFYLLPVLEHLPHMYKVPGSITGTIKKKSDHVRDT